MQESDRPNQLHRGKVVAIRSSVIDVRFEEELPELYSQLRTGDDGDIVIEVVNHLDSQTIRGIALTPTAGIARGSTVTNTTKQLQVPVGKRTLGRVFNVFGEAIDNKQQVTGGSGARSINHPYRSNKGLPLQKFWRRELKRSTCSCRSNEGKSGFIWRCRGRKNGIDY